MKNRLTLAHLIIFAALSLAIIAAHVIELIGYKPCQLCLYQRIPYYIALTSYVFYFGFRYPLKLELNELFFSFYILAVLASSILISGFHVGVEFHWWEGLSSCSSSISASNPDDLFAEIKNTKMVSCDKVAIYLFGLSLAAWNFLLSAILLIGLVRIAVPNIFVAYKNS